MTPPNLKGGAMLHMAVKRASRPLTVTLALLLVPAVMLFGIQPPALAGYGNSVPFSVTTDDELSTVQNQAYLRCNGNARYYAGTGFLKVEGKVSCKYDRWLSDDPSSFDSASSSIGFYGTSASSGLACGTEFEYGGDLAPSLEFVTADFGVTDCNVSEVCIYSEVEEEGYTAGTFHWRFNGCVGVSLGTIPSAGGEAGSCPFGTPKFAEGHEEIYQSGPYVHKAGFVIWRTEGMNTLSSWTLYYRKNTSGYPSWGGTWKTGPGSGAATGSWNAGHTRWDKFVPTSSAEISTADGLPVGVWVVLDSIDQVARTASSFPGGPLKSLNGTWTDGNPATHVNLGDTDPAQCVFWFGPNLSNDEPWGPIATDMGDGDTPLEDPEEPATEDDCDFAVTDPSTWLEAGMCAATGLLGAIWETLKQILSWVSQIPGLLSSILSAIGGLAGDIASAIIDALAALFIPSDGFLEGQIAGLQDAFAESQPGAWVAAIGDLAPSGSVSGCSGPTVEFDVYDVHKSFQPLDACSAPMSTVAATAKLLLTVGLVVFGGLACLRAIGSGMNWNPGIGGRGDSA